MPKHKVWINKRYLKTKKLLLNRTSSPVSSPRRFTKPWERGWRYPLPLGSLVTCYKIQQKWYFSAKKSFSVLNLRSEFRTKDARTRKRSFTFFLVFIFSFFSFFGFFIFHFLVSHLNRSPDRKVYVFWKEAITADLASSDSASFFEMYVFRFQLWSVLSKVYY